VRKKPGKKTGLIKTLTYPDQASIEAIGCEPWGTVGKSLPFAQHMHPEIPGPRMGQRSRGSSNSKA